MLYVRHNKPCCTWFVESSNPALVHRSCSPMRSLQHYVSVAPCDKITAAIPSEGWLFDVDRCADAARCRTVRSKEYLYRLCSQGPFQETARYMVEYRNCDTETFFKNKARTCCSCCMIFYLLTCLYTIRNSSWVDVNDINVAKRHGWLLSTRSSMSSQLKEAVGFWMGKNEKCAACCWSVNILG